MAQPTTNTTTPSRPTQTLTYAAIVIVAGVIATTLAQTQVLARLPLQNLLKNELHLDRGANAAFFFWASLAWYLKPLAGIVTDAFPLFGSRRRTYLLLSATLGAAAWIALIATPHAYGKLLTVAIVINIFMVVTSTVVGGYMVETAQSVSGSSRLTALRQFVTQGCVIINGPIAGYMASIAFGWTAGACGLTLFLLVPVTALFLREQRTTIDTNRLLSAAGDQLRNIASGLATATFYKQQNELHLDTQAQGFLQLISGICGVLAALLYATLCRRLTLKTLLLTCMSLGTIANLGYLFYSTYPRAQLIEGLNGFGYTLAELALMDLAVRSTPRGSEGLGFSLMVSVRNLALLGTDWFGSALLDQYHLSFNNLVVANTVTTAITIPLVFLLPRIVLRGRDGFVDVPIPRTATE